MPSPTARAPACMKSASAAWAIIRKLPSPTSGARLTTSRTFIYATRASSPPKPTKPPPCRWSPSPCATATTSSKISAPASTNARDVGVRCGDFFRTVPVPSPRKTSPAAHGLFWLLFHNPVTGVLHHHHGHIGGINFASPPSGYFAETLASFIVGPHSTQTWSSRLLGGAS